MRLELEGVGGFVQGNPEAELVTVNAHHLDGLVDIRLHEKDFPGDYRLFAKQAQVVLAEDAPPQVAQQKANFGADDGLIDPAHHHLGEGAALLLSFAVQFLNWLEKLLEGNN